MNKADLTQIYDLAALQESFLKACERVLSDRQYEKFLFDIGDRLGVWEEEDRILPYLAMRMRLENKKGD